MISRIQRQLCIPEKTLPGAAATSGGCGRAGHFTLDAGAPAAAAGAAPAEPSTTPRLPRVLDEIETRRQRLDAAIERAVRGEEFSPAQLLALQARVYAYNEQVELVTRVVDKSVSSVKSVLNTQL